MGLVGKTENLKIEKKANVIAWQIPLQTNVTYNITIAEGLQCIVYKNGVKTESLYASSDKSVIKTKGDEYKIVAVNRTNVTPVRCGCGNVAFKDYEIDFDTVVGMNGECRIKIINPYQFVDLFEDLTNVTNEMIEDYFRKNLSKILALKLTADLEKYGRDTDKQITMMGEPIKQVLGDQLKKFGLEVEEFTVNGVRFQDDYLAAIQEKKEKKAAEKQARKEKREKEEKEDRELDMLERINKMSGAKKEAEPEFVVCGLCGFKNEVGTAFCKKCGNKLK